MLQSFIYERAIFKKGRQKQFIRDLETKLSLKEMAALCACSTRTIRDWRREKFHMQRDCVRKLCRSSGIRMPKIEVRNQYAHLSAAGEKGYAAVIKKFGVMPRNEELRKRRWKQWWSSYGQFHALPFQPQEIHMPRKSAKLAEFIGIMMGDGGMSKYQATITLHHTDDREYIEFVSQHIERLFLIKPRVYHYPLDSVFDLTVSRLNLVQYLHSLGLPIGNKVKQQFDIPEWIKVNKSFSRACVRGLVDTDGSIFTHSYKVNGKRYYYKKLAFCSRSKPLQHSVAQILSDFGMRPRISGYDVRLESIEDMKKYFSVIGSHNPKHLKRYFDSSRMQ